MGVTQLILLSVTQVLHDLKCPNLRNCGSIVYMYTTRCCRIIIPSAVLVAGMEAFAVSCGWSAPPDECVAVRRRGGTSRACCDSTQAPTASSTTFL